MMPDPFVLPVVAERSYHARAPGYSFLLSDEYWTLDKNVRINVGHVGSLLSEPTRTGFLQALAFYASELSSHHVNNVHDRLRHMLISTGADEINEVMLINYRATLNPRTEWYLGVISGFLRRWHRLGYPGVSMDVIRLLDGWTIKGNRKGDAVKRKDPEAGPLTDNELQAFNEGAVQAFERDVISLSEMAMCLVTSSTGRRPIQISHLRVGDILSGKNMKNEPLYLLNVPRGKQQHDFRASFKPFAITEDLLRILDAQAKHSIKQVEELLGFRLQQADRQQIPLFPDVDVVKSIASPRELRDLLKTDKLHIASAVVSDVLQFVADAAGIHSERTGDVLRLNARRFRYTTGTRAAREGFGELVIAELLDHTDTQNAGVYIKNIPEHVKRLDEAVGFQLAPYAQAFAGVLVDAEKQARRGGDPTSRIRTEGGRGIGTCGEFGFCGANVPIPCYTCMHFQPWLDGPHEEVYAHLIDERDRLIDLTGDVQVTTVLDRSILAVADVIQRCNRRRVEMSEQGVLING
ncbi:site-specific integrase [Halothiobacillus sp.]|uniref:site-specific integrase n=1 Tax=Halothiobacillus sp. TaxID=1891311 RepID=UPI002601B245|nr:site-specific integrase [Halothiobacillus sp.]MDD4965506.1 site-specific integrase [Halothiobacillus sp.]